MLHLLTFDELYLPGSNSQDLFSAQLNILHCQRQDTPNQSEKKCSLFYPQLSMGHSDFNTTLTAH